MVRSSKRVTIVCHHNADPDAVGSAYALHRLLKKLNPKIRTRLLAPEGVGGISKTVVEKIHARFEDETSLDQTDIIFLVDTNTTSQLGDWREELKKTKKPVVVIDHHARHPETSTIASLTIIDERSTSTCEIIFQLYQKFNVSIDRTSARALLFGLTYDSGHFTIATADTLEIAASLIRRGAKLEETISTLTSPMSDSERMARLKAAQRIEIGRIGEWIIATTVIRSHQASAARAFLGLGAHVAMAAGEKMGKLRVSMRSCRQFNSETGIHLGRDLAKPLGDALNGTGGGHESAAGVNGTGQVEVVSSKFNELLSKLLKGK